ncbi:MAG: PDZ domain-containing protein, partial [Cyclobacteriaceae bacterium]
SVFTVPVTGGDATRITWHPSGALVRGWTTDGKHILYASSRDTAPSRHHHLWTVPAKGGPSELLTDQWGNDGSYQQEGNSIVIDKMRRWDVEWRAYRGGQNTPLIVLDLRNQSEVLIPNEKTTDIQPVWLGNGIYFLSDRDWTMNIWRYDVKTKNLRQITNFTGDDIKTLSGNGNQLVYERSGFLYLYDLNSKDTKKLSVNLTGDFPWAAPQWEDVSSRARFASLSPSGKRVVMEARGEIFTVPVEYGDARNITNSSGIADRRPIWSPKGDKIAWFSDGSSGKKDQRKYALLIADQDGLSSPKKIDIGESKLAWEPLWSPDGKYIAFADDDVRIKVLTVSTGNITLVDVGGTNLERGRNGLAWSPDSKMLAYSKSGSNNFNQIKVWSMDTKKINNITDSFADAVSPAWDADRKHLYFLASTDVALGSGWANTSAMTSRSNYSAYVVNLQNDLPSPFKLRSDEESTDGDSKDSGDKKKSKDSDKADKKEAKDQPEAMKIDFDNIARRTIPLPVPARDYRGLLTGPEGVVFILEGIPNSFGATIHKFVLEDRKSKEFLSNVNQISISADRKKMLVQTQGKWKVIDTSGPNGKKGKPLNINLQMKLDRQAEWEQIFEEAWRYEKDYFYDPSIHGRDWNDVYTRYAPLVPHVKHRSDLNYILDQVNGELSVGHSFVRGGDMPETDNSKVGLLGADLKADKGRWQIERIYTTESWNPGLSSPLDEPGLKVKEGNYLVGINGKPMSVSDNPYQMLDGTLGKQTVLHINDKAEFDGAWKVIVKPIRSENALRQRAWVEDNRKMVDKLSGGRLAYVWIPNTSGNGFVSFNRYFFAQQDKEGAVIDERFNGGGLLDDYMVDLMTRKLRAALTNEVPGGKPMTLPAGILGPKVLLINEMAGSGGDFFPWVFRQQKAGPLIGATTWGGLVKSSTHYRLIDGGSLTSPDNAVFDPINNKWIAENEGVAPDIAVRQDAKALSEGKDPQLERAVEELLKMLEKNPKKEVKIPEFSTPAVKKN